VYIRPNFGILYTLHCNISKISYILFPIIIENITYLNYLLFFYHSAKNKKGPKGGLGFVIQEETRYFRVRQSAMYKGNYFVYILTNPRKTVLYTGVTNDLYTRVLQHYEIEETKNLLRGGTIAISLFIMRFIKR
jgi:hypothetical protein